MGLGFRESGSDGLSLISIGMSDNNDHVVYLTKSLNFASRSFIIIPKKGNDEKPKFTLEQITMIDTRIPGNASNKEPITITVTQLKIYPSIGEETEYLFPTRQNTMHLLYKNSQRSR